MITLTRQKIGSHRIYEKAEFTLPYKPWREAVPGEYGISDDGYISECLREETLGDNLIKVYPYGKAMVGTKTLFSFQTRYSNKAWGLGNRSNAEVESKKSRSKRFVQAYVQMFLAGKMDWGLLGDIWSPKTRIPAATAKRLIKNKWIKQMIDEALKGELVNRGIDKSYYLDRLQEAIEIARVKKDAANMLKAVDVLGTLLNIHGDSQKTTETVEFKVTKELSDLLLSEEKTLTITNGTEREDPLQITG